MTSELLSAPTTLFTPLSVLGSLGGKDEKGLWPLGYQAGVSAERNREGAGGADGTFEQSLGGKTMRVFFKGVNKVRTAKDENWPLAHSSGNH